ncbi:MAG: hypothetical protein L0Z62_00020 [Gemmataceae bacterium]|nr:hypothetical protein [Gemmataceae bacterium]
MRYFTPELFVRLQECQDAAQFRSVNAEWERAAKAYMARLQELLPSLEGGLRRFVKHGSLHDARVLDIATDGRRVTIFVQEEAAPTLLSLTYSLVDAPVIDRNALPEEHRSSLALWLYDEVEVDPDMMYHPQRRVQEGASALTAEVIRAEGWMPIFRHSILLANGWEIRLRFHRLRKTQTTSLLWQTVPAPHPDDSLSRSA